MEHVLGGSGPRRFPGIWLCVPGLGLEKYELRGLPGAFGSQLETRKLDAQFFCFSRGTLRLPIPPIFIAHRVVRSTHLAM
jgi:hypothetical protein